MEQFQFPRSQGEMVKMVRGSLTQAQFAKQLGIDPSCVSRYETGRLGLPTKFLDMCLTTLSSRTKALHDDGDGFDRALQLARETVALLECARTSKDFSGRRRRRSHGGGLP